MEARTYDDVKEEFLASSDFQKVGDWVINFVRAKQEKLGTSSLCEPPVLVIQFPH
jgi:hypothetical protein